MPRGKPFQSSDPAYYQRRASDPLASAWVAASAGTGKTKVLTDRVLRLLLAGAEPHRILCLTFTKAAAAEMSTRVFAILARWTIASDETLKDRLADLLGRLPEAGSAEEAALLSRARTLFARILDAPDGLRIQTIHSFCQTLLKRFPLEADVSPHFDILDDREATVIKTRVRDAIADQIAHDPEQVPALADAWRQLAQRLDEGRFSNILNGLVSKRARLESALEAHNGLDGLLNAVYDHFGAAPGKTARDCLEEACADDAISSTEALRRCAETLLASVKSKTDRQRGERIAAFLACSDVAARADGFEDYRDAFLTGEGLVRKALCTKAVDEAFPDLAETLRIEAVRLADVCRRLKACALADISAALFRLADHMLKDYRRRKKTLGRLDYEDLVLRTRSLLSTEAAAAWVLYKLDGGLDHLLVDEAQDTSAEQWDIARLIADAFFADAQAFSPRRPRTVFAVGDRKQSIYGFQGADPRVFETMHTHFRRQLDDLGGRFVDVPLNLSFRSTEPVLRAVNTVFRTAPARDGVLAEGEDGTHVAFRRNDGGIVEVWPPIVAEETQPPSPWKPPVETTTAESARERLAHCLARRIRGMTSGNDLLESRGRAVRPGDIMVLVRSRSGFEKDLVAALKNADVPVAGIDRLMLADQIAVMDLMALGRVMVLPEDDLSLAALLKSPLFGLTEDQLFTLAHGRRPGLRLWSRLYAAAREERAFAEALTTLANLRPLAMRLPPYAFFTHVLDGPFQGRKRFLARLGGEVEDPLDEFLALALAYESVAPPSMQGFLFWVDQGDTEIKRDLDQADVQAVRILTVHGSKGLQAPIVILPDTFSMPRSLETLYWATDSAGRDVPLWCPSRAEGEDRIEALRASAIAERDREYRRLLYVAMTRAADRLYICGWKTRRSDEKAEQESWYALVRNALAPVADEVYDPEAIRDGLPDAPILRLRKSQEAPVPGTAEARPDPAGDPPSWLREPAPPIARPTRPLTPSHLLDDDGTGPSPLAQDERTVSRFQRGRLIHRLLQSLPGLAPDQQRSTAQRFLSRPLWDLDRHEIDSLTDEVLGVLHAPDCAPLFAEGSQAEVPLQGWIGEHVVSGQVDRLAVRDTDVLVADYKTNRPAAVSVDTIDPAYVRQMAAYRHVLRDIFPDKRIRCFIVWTDTLRLMELPQTALDAELRRVFSELSIPEASGAA